MYYTIQLPILEAIGEKKGKRNLIHNTFVSFILLISITPDIGRKQEKFAAKSTQPYYKPVVLTPSKTLHLRSPSKKTD